MMLSGERLGEESDVLHLMDLECKHRMDGVLVIGEAVWRVPPERAEFLIEITASAAHGGAGPP